jgi:hypothetical protein
MLLARRSHRHIHFIPTYSSWLNQVERFFALITDKTIRRGSLTSVKELVRKIDSLRHPVQQALYAVRLDSHRRFHLGEARTTYLTNQRDRTLGQNSKAAAVTVLAID